MTLAGIVGIDVMGINVDDDADFLTIVIDADDLIEDHDIDILELLIILTVKHDPFTIAQIIIGKISH